MASPEVPDVLSIAEMKAVASAKLPPTLTELKEYYNEGASDLITLRDNEAAYNRFKIRPRILRDVSKINTRTIIFGQDVTLPFGFSPAAMHCLAHPDGEKATSRAAASTGIAMGLSTYATTAMEDVIAQRGPEARNPYAFQLSIVKDRDVTLSWIKRAEAAGFKALFITVDAPVIGLRLNESKNKFVLPDHLSLPHIPKTYKNEKGELCDISTQNHHYPGRDPSNSWESAIPWVKANTKLDVWLKGIYTPEDVLMAIQYGVDGVIVSNHGGRQLDGVPATIDALPECAAVAKGRIKIGIDGGIRRGSDIFKALALGADFCFMGRVPLWGLAYNGQEGVERAVRILEGELRTVMALAGCANIKEISRHHLSVIGANGLLCKL